MLLVICTWVNLSILQHSFECKIVVDALNAFGKGISYYHLCIRSALSSSVTVATTCIRHVTFSLIDV